MSHVCERTSGVIRATPPFWPPACSEVHPVPLRTSLLLGTVCLAPPSRTLARKAPTSRAPRDSPERACWTEGHERVWAPSPNCSQPSPATEELEQTECHYLVINQEGKWHHILWLCELQHGRRAGLRQPGAVQVAARPGLVDADGGRRLWTGPGGERTWGQAPRSPRPGSLGPGPATTAVGAARCLAWTQPRPG